MRIPVLTKEIRELVHKAGWKSRGMCYESILQWLREEYEIFIVVKPVYEEYAANTWEFRVINHTTCHKISADDDYPGFNEARNAGIESALKSLL